MPFDALTQTIVHPLLARIGLVPVPKDVVEPHKRRAEQAAYVTLRHTNPDNAYVRFHRHSQWRTFHSGSAPEVPPPTRWQHCRGWLRAMVEGTPNSTPGPEMRFLSYMTRLTVSHTAPVRVGIPAPAVAVANKVQQRLASQGIKAAFSVEVFDTDPILYLHLKGEHYCLAIWDYDRNGEVVIENLATFT